MTEERTGATNHVGTHLKDAERYLRLFHGKKSRKIRNSISRVT